MNKFKSMAIEGYVKNKYPQYFRDGAFSVELNTEAGACRVSATLAGEDAPVAVDIKRYRVVSALPIFPGGCPPSIFGTFELNYRVRDGNGWTLKVINTDYAVM